jgi:anhydro-N-acetylmuramic acid kinase
MIGVGLMCGTSLDGIDAVRVSLTPRPDGYDVVTDAFDVFPLPDDLRDRLLAASPPNACDVLTVSRLHADAGDALAAAAVAIGADRAHFVASHGITLAHDGDAHCTLQIGDAFRIRERTGRTVVFDFRSADTAAGGHGAPLVPYVDRLLLASRDETRVALNLGGIANLTVLPAGAPASGTIAFDSGPANLALDAYATLRSGGRMRRDDGGARAAAGRVDAALLDAMLADPYFTAPPPKSTGRERFGTTFVARFRAGLDALSFDDALATLTALTIRSVAAAIRSAAPDAARVVVAGGGVHNGTILGGLRAELPGVAIDASDAFGIDPDAKEAIAFAILGREALAERAAGLPGVTGSRGPRVLGAIAPAGLTALLAAVDGEERAR